MADWLISISAPLEGEIPDSYNVYTKDADDAEGEFTLAADGVTGSSVTLTNLLPTGRLSVAVVPVSDGVEWDESAWETQVIRPGSVADLAAPNVVSNFSVAQKGGDLAFSWSAVTNRKIKEYEIRRGATWAAGIKRKTVPGASTEARFGWQISGSKTYHIKAKTDQQESGTAASVTINIKANTEFVFASSTDESAAGYAGGTLTNLTNNSGTLEPVTHPTGYSNMTAAYTTYTDPWWWPIKSDGNYVTAWTDEGAVVDAQVEVDLTPAASGAVMPGYRKMRGNLRDFVSVTGAALEPDAQTLGQRISYSGTLLEGPTVKVEIDTAQDGVPTSDGWRIWVPGAVYKFRQYRLRVTPDIFFPYIYPTVTSFERRLLLRNLKVEASGTTNTTGFWDYDYSGDGFANQPYAVAQCITNTGRFASVEFTGSNNVRVWSYLSADPPTTTPSITVHLHLLGT